MFSKLFLAISPLISALAPVCSSSLPTDLTVFASMMNKESPRPPEIPEADRNKTDPETISYDFIFRVMSFNIRSDDHLKDDGNYPWSDRKSKVASTIRFHHADLIGLQETCQNQLNDLKETLSEYICFDGVEMGTISRPKEDASLGTPVNHPVRDPIFFRNSRFDLLDSGTFFLSETPDVPSKSWDAKFLRGVSWVKLFDKKTRKEFYFFNTHFDYHSRVARDESAKLLRKQVAHLAKTVPFAVAGDFNFFPKLGGQETYEILTEGLAPFIDAQKASLFPHHGPTGTWSGFKEAGQPGIKPDCIFVSPQVEVFHHGILSDSFDGQFPSDHLPVVADIHIK